MSTPDTDLSPYTEGYPVSPSAVAGPQPSAAHGLGGVLRTLVLKSGAYHTENDQDAAVDAVTKWVNSQLSASDKRALNTGDEHAPKEDVTLRTPPGGAAPVVVSAAPAIDYHQLAAALVELGIQPSNRQETVSELCGLSR